MARGDGQTALFPPARNHVPDKQAIFWIKSRLLILRRMAQDMFAGPAHLAHQPQVNIEALPIIAEDRSPLFTVIDPREQLLELGKVENLRIAARALDGRILPAEKIFSFWRMIGRPTAGKGYVEGRELRSGCMIPTIAGGICQLTNALSRCAHQAECVIVEQHKHSAAVDGLVIDPVTDATVYWNYLDLRFTYKNTLYLSVCLTEKELVVRFLATSE
jgi:vancomycin resistance protein YoaR